MIKNTLYKLHDDHKNFLKLLTYLEQQHHLLEEYKRSDLNSILDAIKYMKEYPDHIHHPLENIVFEYFIENHEEARDEIIKLIHEHEAMPLLTDKLLEMLQGALADVPQSRDELCAYLKEYISIQKEHMNQEESYVYPILSSKLGEKDWEKIDTKLSDIEDPLFGKRVEKLYLGLFQKIVS